MRNIKKGISTILILLFFITIIASVSAAADNTSISDVRSNDTSDNTQVSLHDRLYSYSEYAKNKPIRRLRSPENSSIYNHNYDDEIEPIIEDVNASTNNNKTVKIRQPKTDATVYVDVDDSFKILGKLKANTIVFDENQTLINSGVVTYYLNDEVISSQNITNGFSRLNYSLDKTKIAGRYLFKVTFTHDV